MSSAAPPAANPAPRIRRPEAILPARRGRNPARELAGRLLAGGSGTWALSKLVKQMVRRPRPATLVSVTHSRGRDASWLGYLSGHAGVAIALGMATFPRLSPWPWLSSWIRAVAMPATQALMAWAYARRWVRTKDAIRWRESAADGRW